MWFHYLYSCNGTPPTSLLMARVCFRTLSNVVLVHSLLFWKLICPVRWGPVSLVKKCTFWDKNKLNLSARMHEVKPSFSQFIWFMFHIGVTWKTCCLCVYSPSQLRTVNENIKHFCEYLFNKRWELVLQSKQYKVNSKRKSVYSY
jgi:hypothetical protein